MILVIFLKGFAELFDLQWLWTFHEAFIISLNAFEVAQLGGLVERGRVKKGFPGDPAGSLKRSSCDRSLT